MITQADLQSHVYRHSNNIPLHT